MSSRVLRKLQGENDLIKSLPNEEVSDPDSDIPTSGAIKKNFNINRYDLVSLFIYLQPHLYLCYFQFIKNLEKRVVT